MKTEIFAIVAYASFLLLGALIGYFSANSLPSLIMGTLSSFLLFATSWGISQKIALARPVAMLTIAFLMTFFAFRFYSTLGFFPAGFMVILSALVLLFLLYSKKIKQRLV